MPATPPFNPDKLLQSWPLPKKPRPVVIFGAGSIVKDAHLPAYKMALAENFRLANSESAAPKVQPM